MDKMIKQTLERQLELLAIQSERDMRNIASYTEQMINLARLIDPELRTQSYAAALSRLPEATLTMSDLEEIVGVRKERLRRADKALQQMLDECHQKCDVVPERS